MPATPAAPTLPAPYTTPSGLRVETLKAGKGRVAKRGSIVRVHYVGTFPDGRKFDSSRDRHEPFQFQIGYGEVIKGWDEGVDGMPEGGLRRLTVPPALAYGDRGFGRLVPPGATLIFEIELLDVL